MPDLDGPERIRDRDEDRRRLGRASAELLGVALGGVSVVTGLLLWHLARRGRRIREGLDPPRPVRWPDEEPETLPIEPDDLVRHEDPETEIMTEIEEDPDSETGRGP